MRIPITIKIPVNDAGKPSGLVAARVLVRDVGSGLEKVTVRALGIKRPAPPSPRQLEFVRPAQRRDLTGQHMATRFPVVYHNGVPPATAVSLRPPIRYSVKTFHITLTWPSLPSWREFRHWIGTLSRSNLGRACLVIVLAGIFAFGWLVWPGHHTASDGTQAAASKKTAPELTRGTPGYTTVLPAGKTIDQLGGWVRISPSNADPVYTYADTVNDVHVTVSEQPLPEKFKTNTTSQLAQLAQSFNANQKFTAADNVQAYVATAESGEQSVILAKNGLLILIKSAASLSSNQWVAYISSLH
jgi:hypothetical protein